MPTSRASSTASDDGADTAASTGMPAITAFWVSSNDARPLTRRTVALSGIRSFSSAQPTAGAGEHLLSVAQSVGEVGQRFSGDGGWIVAGTVLADCSHRVQGGL